MIIARLPHTIPVNAADKHRSFSRLVALCVLGIGVLCPGLCVGYEVVGTKFDALEYAHFYANPPLKAPIVDKHDPCRYALESASVDTPKSRVLTTITYEFVVTLDSSCQVRPAPPNHDAVTCAPPEVQTTIKDPQTLRHKFTISCQFARPGIFFTTPFQAEVFDTHGTQIGRHYPGNIRIDIEAIAPSYNLAQQISPQIPLKPWKSTIIQEVLVAIAALISIVAIAFAYLLLRHPKPIHSHTERVYMKPIEAFNAQIAPLLDIEPSSIEENKALYDKLAFAMRELIDALFECDAFNRTTPQIVAQLRHKHVDNSICDDVERILNEIDRIKFTDLPTSRAATIMLMRDMCECAPKLDEIAHSEEFKNAQIIAQQGECKRQTATESSKGDGISPNAQNAANPDIATNVAISTPSPGDAVDPYATFHPISDDQSPLDRIDPRNPMRFAPPGLAAITPKTPDESLIIDVAFDDNTGWTPNPHRPVESDIFAPHSQDDGGSK